MSDSGDEKKAPINTSTRQELDMFLLAAGILGGPQAIYAQEAEGQQSFVTSTTLPTRCSEEDKQILEAAGVKFLQLVEGDPLFQYVELPQGWKLEGTDHPMHSRLHDDKGRARAGIFYKAAFYDRDADMNLLRRYEVVFDYKRARKEGICIASVRDGGKEVIHTTEPIPAAGPEYEFSHKPTEAATKWLDQHFPDWRNPGAYWD